MVVTRFRFARVSDVLRVPPTRFKSFEDAVSEDSAREQDADMDVVTSMDDLTMILTQSMWYGQAATHSRLMTAAGENMNQVLTFLLDPHNGDDVLSIEDVDEDGKTALMHAAEEQNVHGIRLLVRAGAMVNARNIMTGMTAIHYACLKTIKDPSCSTVQALLDAGADVNALDNNHRSALHETCQESQPYPSLILIRNGCDIAQADNMGDTPLHLACGDCGDCEIAGILLGLGANPYALNIEGMSPLHLSRDSDVEVLEHMIEFCPTLDINFKNADGDTLLHLLGHDDDGFELIMKKGALVDSLNNGGEMAIHVLARQGCTSSIELIFQLGLFLGKSHLPGFDLETPNLAGLSPGSIAHNAARYETAKFIDTTALLYRNAEDSRKQRLMAFAMGGRLRLGGDSLVSEMKEETLSFVLHLLMQDPLKLRG